MKISVIDIGGTALKSGIWVDGKLENCAELPYDSSLGCAVLLSEIKNIISSHTGVERIGISTAGLIDSEKGIVMMASNIKDYTGTNLRKELGEAFNLPVFVENDVNSAAIAEAVYGAGAEFESFICLAYGTGIGGAIIKDKQVLHRGANFAAGEMGHIITHAEDKLPGDVRSGCYELYAATTALVQTAKKYDASLTNGRKIFENIQNENVKAIVDAWIVEIMIGLCGLIHTFDPPCVVLGGGIMAQPYIIETLNKLKPLYLMPLYCNTTFKAAQMGNYTGLLGAGYLAATQL